MEICYYKINFKLTTMNVYITRTDNVRGSLKPRVDKQQDNLPRRLNITKILDVYSRQKTSPTALTTLLRFNRE